MLRQPNKEGVIPTHHATLSATGPQVVNERV
jgi:hypothetical protein